MNNENEIKRLKLYLFLLREYEKLSDIDYLDDIHNALYDFIGNIYYILNTDRSIKAFKLVEEQLHGYKDNFPNLVKEIEDILREKL